MLDAVFLLHDIKISLLKGLLTQLTVDSMDTV